MKSNSLKKSYPKIDQHPLYSTWRAMRHRCRKGNTSSKNYGDRGIEVCERWGSFANFVEDMGERPDGCSLDRVDNNGNYHPDNCRWATRDEQNRNKRGKSTNSTGYRNVQFDKSRGKFIAWVSLGGGKKKNIGRFETALEAVEAQNKWKLENKN